MSGRHSWTPQSSLARTDPECDGSKWKFVSSIITRSGPDILLSNTVENFKSFILLNFDKICFVVPELNCQVYY